MGLCVEDHPISGSNNLTVSQVIYEAALIIALLRWVLCFLFRRAESNNDDDDEEHFSKESWEMLPLTSFGEFMERLQPQTTEEDTCCAVCLNQLKMEDEVRELINCYHVFHRECIDKWLEHEHHNHNYNPTCPLCRAPLLLPYSSCDYYSHSLESSSTSTCLPLPPQPSWAIERLLYLFGDDLLPC